ncbi:hypothetical protein N9N85_02660, partial [Schleiferiaceae bacterium]|nr:hypothetical protein [Schleiferiaceae bacterium]
MSQKPPQKKGNMPKFSLNWIYLAVFGSLLALNFVSANYSATAQESNFNDLTSKVQAGHIDKVKVVNK